MTLSIQDKDTAEVLFLTEDAFTAPNVGEYLMVDDMWYKVVYRNFTFGHLNSIDHNFCAVFVEPYYTRLNHGTI